MVIIITKCAAYDSFDRFGLDNSERIVCQISNFVVFDDRLLAGHKRALDSM